MVSLCVGGGRRSWEVGLTDFFTGAGHGGAVGVVVVLLSSSAEKFIMPMTEAWGAPRSGGRRAVIGQSTGELPLASDGRRGIHWQEIPGRRET